MTILNCNEKECINKAVLFSNYCYEHTKDKNKLIEEIHDFIKKTKILKDFNFSYIPLNNLDFSDKDISYSFFSHCEIKNSNFTKASMISTFFDFADLENANFTNSFSRFSIFGGANLKKANIFDSIMFASNFIGANIEDALFKNADLSYSRFISCKIINTSFNNCNLKKTFFNDSVLDEISKKTSNYHDVYILKESDSKIKIEGFDL